MKPKRPCAYPRCPNYTTGQWCPLHASEQAAKRRGSDVRWSSWWRKLRQQVLNHYGRRCAECGTPEDELKARGRTLQLHHKDGDKDNCEPGNLVPLCSSPCHPKAQAELRWRGVKARRDSQLPPWMRDDAA